MGWQLSVLTLVVVDAASVEMEQLNDLKFPNCVILNNHKTDVFSSPNRSCPHRHKCAKSTNGVFATMHDLWQKPLLKLALINLEFIPSSGTARCSI